ncbi:MAG: helix-turn-helix transcriptional regulator [Paracoccaceae bacterium]
MTELLPLLSRIASCKRIEDVWSLSAGYFRTFGFSRANYGYTRFRHDRSIGDPDDAIFLSTADAEYTRLYFRGGFFARTPVYRWAVANEGICTWAWVQKAYDEGRLTPEEAEAVRQNAQMGVAAGIAVSFPESSTRAKGALGLIADKDLTHADVETIFARHEHELLALANMMHLKIIQLPGGAGRRALTSRQREVLEWVADGKTMQDVACIMGVSPAMVEKHLRLAREALDVDTTAQAVAKAAMMNIIFHHDPAPEESGMRLRAAATR